MIGVFDGHGGSEVSRFLVKTLPQVKKYIIEIVRDSYVKSKKRGRALFEDAFDTADKIIADKDY